MKTKLSIPKELVIRRTDTEDEKIHKIVMISIEMIKAGMETQTVEWLCKMIKGLPLEESIKCVAEWQAHQVLLKKIDEGKKMRYKIFLN